MSWTWAGPGRCRRRLAVRRLEAVDREQLNEGGGRRRRRVHDRHPVAGDAGDHVLQQRVVGAAEQQRVDPGGGGHREHELAGGVAHAQERGE